MIDKEPDAAYNPPNYDPESLVVRLFDAAVKLGCGVTPSESDAATIRAGALHIRELETRVYQLESLLYGPVHPAEEPPQ